MATTDAHGGSTQAVEEGERTVKAVRRGILCAAFAPEAAALKNRCAELFGAGWAMTAGSPAVVLRCTALGVQGVGDEVDTSSLSFWD